MRKSLRTVLAGLVLLWLVVAVVGTAFHIVRLLLYVAILATAAVLLVTFMGWGRARR